MRRLQLVLRREHADVLRQLAAGEWAQPFDLAGYGRSGPLRLLAALLAVGFVERRPRPASYLRPSYVYRITEAGLEWLATFPKQAGS